MIFSSSSSGSKSDATHRFFPKKKPPTLTLSKISLIDQIDHCVQVSIPL